MVQWEALRKKALAQDEIDTFDIGTKWASSDPKSLMLKQLEEDMDALADVFDGEILEEDLVLL